MQSIYTDSALVAALSRLIYNILTVVLTSDSYTGPVLVVLSAMLLFNSIYTSFASVPGLIAFQDISKQRGK